jgi:SNF2 family DNA or RNA helicase
LTAHSDTRLTGIVSLLQPLLLRRAKKAIRKGVLKELQQKYCQ